MIKKNAMILRKCDVSSHLNVLGFRLHKLKTQQIFFKIYKSF